VPEPVRPHVRCTRHVLQQLVDRTADLARVNPPTSSAQEQCPSTAGRNHLAATQLQPSLQRDGSRATERDSPWLAYPSGTRGSLFTRQQHLPSSRLS